MEEEEEEKEGGLRLSNGMSLHQIVKAGIAGKKAIEGTLIYHSRRNGSGIILGFWATVRSSESL